MTRLALTNSGHRRALHLLSDGQGKVRTAADTELLALLEARIRPYAGDAAQRALVAERYAEEPPASADGRAVAARLRKNPIELVSQCVVEFTTRCNFSCPHCYNSGVTRRTETRLDRLEAATDRLSDLGVRDFAFIGGEVSKYGEGWLDLASRLRGSGATLVAVLTNGWFLGERGFEAAGREYLDVAGLLADYRESGVTHVAFSVDGRGAAHDRSRGRKGLYGRILAGLRQVAEAGLEPRVSILGKEKEDLGDLLLELGHAIYGANATRILVDGTNIINNYVDLSGSGPRSGEGGYGLDGADPRYLRCAGFYRPAPFITLKASGELATCRLADAGEGYGNFHDEDLAAILNRMQDSFVYRLHAERRVADYARLVDTGLFGESFSHACVPRALATMVARRMHERGVEPGDTEGLARINLEVALVAGRRPAGRGRGGPGGRP